MRIGVGDGIVRDAIAQAFGIDKKIVEREKGPNPGVTEIKPSDDEPAQVSNTYVPAEAETVIILDEEIPLADVPALGDESAMSMLLVAFAIFALVVINFPEKRTQK